jgi:hypothetical protein
MLKYTLLVIASLALTTAPVLAIDVGGKDLEAQINAIATTGAGLIAIIFFIYFSFLVNPILFVSALSFVGFLFSWTSLMNYAAIGYLALFVVGIPFWLWTVTHD